MKWVPLGKEQQDCLMVLLHYYEAWTGKPIPQQSGSRKPIDLPLNPSGKFMTSSQSFRGTHEF